MADKISHLNNAGFLKSEHKKRTELSLPNGAGYIFSYHPFESMQIIFYDIHTSEIPDLWQLGFRKGDEGRYLRTLICKRGSCHFFVNGSEGILLSGQVMMDYGIGDDKSFLFTSDNFSGVEIIMQVDTLVKESAMLRMLRVVVEEMCLPEEEIFDSNGYVFNYYFTALPTDGQKAAYLNELKQRSLYDTGVDVQPGDPLLTLSTCSYHEDNGRLLVIARALREDEKPEDFLPQTRGESALTVPSMVMRPRPRLVRNGSMS